MNWVRVHKADYVGQVICKALIILCFNKQLIAAVTNLIIYSGVARNLLRGSRGRARVEFGANAPRSWRQIYMLYHDLNYAFVIGPTPVT